MDNKLYVNSDGVKENPSQNYFFNEYWKLPRAKRSVFYLHKVCSNREEANKSEYPTPSIDTLTEYKDKFMWDSRIQDKLLNTDFMTLRLDDNLHEYEDLKKLFGMTVVQAKGMKKHIDWKHTHRLSYKEIELLQKTQKVYNDTLDLLFALNNDLTEVISRVELIQELNKNENDTLPFGELLTDYKE